MGVTVVGYLLCVCVAVHLVLVVWISKHKITWLGWELSGSLGLVSFVNCLDGARPRCLLLRNTVLTYAAGEIQQDMVVPTVSLHFIMLRWQQALKFRVIPCSECVELDSITMLHLSSGRKLIAAVTFSLIYAHLLIIEAFFISFLVSTQRRD